MTPKPASPCEHKNTQIISNGRKGEQRLDFLICRDCAELVEKPVSSCKPQRADPEFRAHINKKMKDMSRSIPLDKPEESCECVGRAYRNHSPLCNLYVKRDRKAETQDSGEIDELLERAFGKSCYCGEEDNTMMCPACAFRPFLVKAIERERAKADNQEINHVNLITEMANKKIAALEQKLAQENSKIKELEEAVRLLSDDGEF